LRGEELTDRILKLLRGWRRVSQTTSVFVYSIS